MINSYKILTKYFLLNTLNIIFILFITLLFLKYFITLLDFNTIYCIDNNDSNQNWRSIRIGTDLGTIFDIGINGGFSYAAYRGAMYFSSSISVALLPIKVGIFAATYTFIYASRRALGTDLNINIFVNNNNNRFNSPLEYGEALDNINTFIESIIIINITTLITFNILVILLANRTIMPHILKWLEKKLTANNLIYRIIERTYRANMKVSIWFIGYIIILIYSCIFVDLWGIYKINIIFKGLIEYINNNKGNIFNSPLEYGEALDNINSFMEALIILNLSILLLFNVLIIVLINRAIIPHILKWLENKLGNNNIIYKFIERIYKANMKVSIWFIGFIVIFIYIFMFVDLFGLNKIQILINTMLEYINNIIK